MISILKRESRNMSFIQTILMAGSRIIIHPRFEDIPQACLDPHIDHRHSAPLLSNRKNLNEKKTRQRFQNHDNCSTASHSTQPQLALTLKTEQFIHRRFVLRIISPITDGIMHNKEVVQKFNLNSIRTTGTTPKKSRKTHTKYK